MVSSNINNPFKLSALGPKSLTFLVIGQLQNWCGNRFFWQQEIHVRETSQIRQTFIKKSNRFWLQFDIVSQQQNQLKKLRQHTRGDQKLDDCLFVFWRKAVILKWPHSSWFLLYMGGLVNYQNCLLSDMPLFFRNREKCRRNRSLPWSISRLESIQTNLNASTIYQWNTIPLNVLYNKWASSQFSAVIIIWPPQKKSPASVQWRTFFFTYQWNTWYMCTRLFEPYTKYGA